MLYSSGEKDCSKDITTSNLDALPLLAESLARYAAFPPSEAFTSGAASPAAAYLADGLAVLAPQPICGGFT